MYLHKITKDLYFIHYINVFTHDSEKNYLIYFKITEMFSLQMIKFFMYIINTAFFLTEKRNIYQR